ncbi:MAG: hypothetical protein HYS27_24035 [Deltaproteobacteria bacterium]|nr:hypothetical protein [Deltaproteobacteria bacterium]
MDFRKNVVAAFAGRIAISALVTFGYAVPPARGQPIEAGTDALADVPARHAQLAANDAEGFIEILHVVSGRERLPERK